MNNRIAIAAAAALVSCGGSSWVDPTSGNFTTADSADIYAEGLQLPFVHAYREGAGVPEGKKSLAVSVTLQPTDRTLTDAEIEAVAARIVAAAQKATGAELRR